jgi:hypothetical protein
MTDAISSCPSTCEIVTSANTSRAVVKNAPSPNCAIRLRQKWLLIDLAGAEFACINVMLVQQL